MNEVAQAARQFEVSIGTVYALCRPGRLAHLRIGTGRGTIRIAPEDIAAFRLKARARGAAAAPDPEPEILLKHLKWGPPN